MFSKGFRRRATRLGDFAATQVLLIDFAMRDHRDHLRFPIVQIFLSANLLLCDSSATEAKIVFIGCDWSLYRLRLEEKTMERGFVDKIRVILFTKSERKAECSFEESPKPRKTSA